jgi:hypothetical protein
VIVRGQASACSTPSPSPIPGMTWICLNGGWVPDNGLAAQPNQPPSSPSAPACPPGFVAGIFGGCVPPNHPLASTNQPALPPSTPPSTPSCPAGFVVGIFGGCVPPDHPLAPGNQLPSTPLPPALTVCETIQPSPTADIVWTCVNGGWVPQPKLR